MFNKSLFIQKSAIEKHNSRVSYAGKVGYLSNFSTHIFDPFGVEIIRISKNNCARGSPAK